MRSVTPMFLARDRLDDLIVALRATDRAVLGPIVRDGGLAIGEIDTSADLATGVGVEADPGQVRLVPSARTFDQRVGPAWKSALFPSRIERLRARREDDDRVGFEVTPPEPRAVALLGLRACDAAAIAVHDRVLAAGPAVDADYAARRAAALLVVAECVAAGRTCFCGSTATGPAAPADADLALTEVDGGFVVRSGSDAGAAVLEGLDLAPADAERVDGARAAVEQVRAATSGQLPSGDIAGRLIERTEHPRWASIAERCLSCTNCTLVCPTCVCTGPTQQTDLDGRLSIVSREWQSCFAPDFASVAGWDVRSGTRERYRQWLTHKFGTWWEQFGTTGCVGCGRCIAWCPVGIDVRAELMAIASPTAPPTAAVAAPTTLGPIPTPTAAPPRAAIGPAPERWLPVVDGHAWEDWVTAEVTATRAETRDVVTLTLAVDDPALTATRPGQFVIAGLPGLAAPPISVSRIEPGLLDLTIRAAGPATTALTRLPAGATVGLRGPFGRPWPLDTALGRDVVLVAGGIGMAPLRPVLEAILAERDRYAAVRLIVGTKTPPDRLYVDELARLARRADVDLRQTVDRPDATWTGPVGLVTLLLAPDERLAPGAVAFVCGPERMMTPVGRSLERLGVPPERVWLSLERNMQCGIGLCGHCQLGSLFVCRDGPVFSLAELGDRLEHEGL